MASVPGAIQPQKNTIGGFNSACMYSGGPSGSLLVGVPGGVLAGADVLLFSGAGRLDCVMLHATVRSGILNGVTFYDAGTVTSGGPFPSSGTKIVASIPQYLSPTLAVQSVLSGAIGPYPPMSPIQFAMPFQSGLCVNTASGQPGFTAVWTPEHGNQ